MTLSKNYYIYVALGPYLKIPIINNFNDSLEYVLNNTKGHNILGVYKPTIESEIKIHLSSEIEVPTHIHNNKNLKKQFFLNIQEQFFREKEILEVKIYNSLTLIKLEQFLNTLEGGATLKYIDKQWYKIDMAPYGSEYFNFIPMYHNLIYKPLKGTNTIYKSTTNDNYFKIFNYQLDL